MALTERLMSTVRSVLGSEQQAQEAAPGPNAVGPVPKQSGRAGAQNPLVPVPMTETQRDNWWREVKVARQRRDARATKWDILLKEYEPIVEPSGTPEALKVNRHFRDVHSKLGQLFYKCPDVVLQPKDPSPASDQVPNPMAAQMPGVPMPPIEMKDVIATKQAVLNQTIGADGIKMQRLMDELLFDVLAWAGIGGCKVGYRCVTKTLPAPEPPPGAVLGLAQPPPQPIPIYEEYYAKRISPKKLLWSPYHNSSRFEESAWVGYEFFMSKAQAMAAFDLTDADLNNNEKDTLRHQYAEDKNVEEMPNGGLVRGVEIFCWSSLYTDEVHPKAIHQLVLIEGIKDKDVVWRPCVDQEFDEQDKLTKDSLLDFPVQILTIRDLADSSYTPSDAAFTNSGIKELTTYRRQDIVRRNNAVGRYLYDEQAFENTDIQNIQNSECGTYHPVGANAMAQGVDKIIALTPQVKSTSDDYRGQEILARELDETLGISSVQAGVPEQTVRTATEIANVQTAVAGRNDKEQSRVVDYFVGCVRMVDQLLMRYATQDDYVTIAGTDGAMRWMIWNNKIISGRYLYSIAPDSQLKVDTVRDKERLQRLYNLTAADPMVNRAYLLQRMYRVEGLDPAKAILDPAQQMLQPQHGGTNPEVANKHQSSESGGRPNEPGMGNHRAAQGAVSPTAQQGSGGPH